MQDDAGKTPDMPRWEPWKWEGGDRFSFEGNLIHGARLATILNSHEQRMKSQADTIRAQQALADSYKAKVFEPIPMLLRCPNCTAVHIDEGEWATRPHKTHRCQLCRCDWRPANVPTVGVDALQQPKADQ